MINDFTQYVECIGGSVPILLLNLQIKRSELNLQWLVCGEHVRSLDTRTS